MVCYFKCTVHQCVFSAKRLVKQNNLIYWHPCYIGIGKEDFLVHILNLETYRERERETTHKTDKIL